MQGPYFSKGRKPVLCTTVEFDLYSAYAMSLAQ